MNDAPLAIFLARLALFLLIGGASIVIGYPLSRLLRCSLGWAAIPVIGAGAVILLVYAAGVFHIPFRVLAIPSVVVALIGWIPALQKSGLRSLHWPARPEIYLLLLAGLAILTRLLQIQSLSVPNWLDGVTHYSITFNLLTRGFVSPARVYHTGFHSLAAFFSLLFPRSSLAEIVLVTGQWLSFLCGLSVYLLVKRLDARPSIPLYAAALAWFFSPFPSYLIAWSRYPLLAGLAFFPVACLAIRDWIREPRRGAFLSVLFGGAVLFLTHYYIFFIWLGCLLLSVLQSRRPRPALWQLLAMALGLLFLVVWRLPAFAATYLAPLATRPLRSILDIREVLSMTRLLFQNGGWAVWILAPLGLLGFSRLQWKRVFNVLLILLLAVGFEFLQNALSATRPQGIQNSMIFFTIPLAYAAALGLDRVFQFVSKRLAPGYPQARYLMASLCGLALLLGAYNISFSLIKPATVLYGAADRDAFAWILSNTARTDIFAITAGDWGSGPQGCDGGSWIVYLTGRQTVLMDGSFDPHQSPAKYIYLGACEDPLETAAAAVPDQVRVFSNDAVKIYRIK